MEACSEEVTFIVMCSIQTPLPTCDSMKGHVRSCSDVKQDNNAYHSPV